MESTMLAKWEWKKLLRDWKTRILLVAFFLFYATFSLLYQQQTVSFPQERMKDQYDNIHRLFNTVPSSDFSGKTGQEVYDILADLQMQYGMQLYILTRQEGNTITGFENIFSDYLEYGTQIAHNQARLLELEDFTYHEYLMNFMPDEETIRRDVQFYDYLAKHDLSIEWNSFSASNIFLQEVHLIIGFSLFLFIALLAGDRFTKDQVKNWSITHGLPVPWRKQWHLRAAQLWLLVWLTSLSGLLTSYIISLFIESPGSLMYPVMTYTPFGYIPIAIWLYAILAIVLAMLLSVFLILLTLGLSWVFRTIYLTMMVTIGWYFIPMLWQTIDPISSWQPSLYLHIEPVLDGTSADAFGLPGIHFLKALVPLLLLILLVEALFAKIFDRIQTQTLGLKRRTTE